MKHTIAILFAGDYADISEFLYVIIFNSFADFISSGSYTWIYGNHKALSGWSLTYDC